MIQLSSYVFRKIVYSLKIRGQNLSASPAPKANEDVAKEIFDTELAKAKTVAALGVRVNAIVGLSIYPRLTTSTFR